MWDSDLLEIVGHPTIPNTQSLRAPPCQVALESSTERLTAATNKAVSRRYVQKLQKERERNKEVLTEYKENLPILIRPMVFPEKISHWNQRPLHLDTTAVTLPSEEKKFRISKHHGDDFWYESTEARTNIESIQSDSSPRNHCQVYNPSNPESEKGHHGTFTPRKQLLNCSVSTDPGFSTQNYVPRAGFQGAHGLQSSNFKYKFYKKPGYISSKPASIQFQTSFKPKGYGSLHDEMEIERRCKTDPDQSNQIHFVRSNFLSGQRIIKKTKLPPIERVPNLPHSLNMGQDILAIMSVQNYNYPGNDIEGRTAVDSSQTTERQSPLFGNVRRRRYTNGPISDESSAGCVPLNMKTPQNSNISDEDNISWLPRKLFKEPDMFLQTVKLQHEDAFLEKPANKTVSKTNINTSVYNKTAHEYYSALPAKVDTSCAGVLRDANSEFSEEPAPFNISVRVYIKPRSSEDEIEKTIDEQFSKLSDDNTERDNQSHDNDRDNQSHDNERDNQSHDNDRDNQSHDNRSADCKATSDYSNNSMKLPNGFCTRASILANKPKKFGLVEQKRISSMQ